MNPLISGRLYAYVYIYIYIYIYESKHLIKLCVDFARFPLGGVYFSNDLKYYMDHYQIKNFSLIGHSMGGKTAMMFSGYFPNAVNKLIVVDILPIYYKNDYQNILKFLKSINLNSIRSRLEADNALSSSIKSPSFRAFLLKIRFPDFEKNTVSRYDFQNTLFIFITFSFSF